MITRSSLVTIMRVTLATIALLAIWQILVELTETPSYILPTPQAIGYALLSKFPLIAKSLAATMAEALGGLAIAVVIALVISIFVVHSRLIRDIVYPMVIALQAVPKVAVAPLLVTWFGLGFESKFVLAALLCFFPLVVAGISGLDNVDQEMFDLARSHGASRLKVLFLIRIPRSLPNFVDGLKVALPSAVIGAVVAEFVAGQVGIGALILGSNTALEIPLTFAGIVALAVSTSALFGLLLLAEYLLLRWRRLELGRG